MFCRTLNIYVLTFTHGSLNIKELGYQFQQLIKEDRSWQKCYCEKNDIHSFYGFEGNK